MSASASSAGVTSSAAPAISRVPDVRGEHQPVAGLGGGGEQRLGVRVELGGDRHLPDPAPALEQRAHLRRPARPATPAPVPAGAVAAVARASGPAAPSSRAAAVQTAAVSQPSASAAASITTGGPVHSAAASRRTVSTRSRRR